MVNVPKEKKHYCRTCNTHTSNKISLYKKSRDNPQREGNRRYRLKQKGFGGQTKPILRRKAKNTKKPVLKLKCTKCQHVQMKPLHRAKQTIISNEKKVKGAALTF
ncbi:LSU ribosomal protein L44E [Enterospora canceri]|uniref:LSU ribosomal protein L44E n=1 Tax=Enterospora canceri TaxID=1081671 RepID=A0A1Y1S9F9_9MICR|nr:LSU ribosomal protein L44E [Enterospora canceri]